MAGHTVTPYQLKAKRARARKNKEVTLNLAALADGTSVDLLDVLEANLPSVAAYESSDKSQLIRCELVNACAADVVTIVFAADRLGEREVLHDTSEDSRPVVFEKGRKHAARYFMCCLVWRPTDGGDGILLLHSPWGRGGTKTQILKLLQSAVRNEPKAKAKLSADAMIPAAALSAILDRANATKITYRRETGVQSDFASVDGTKTAPASMALVVKGTNTLPYRDALGKALKDKANRSKLFVASVADGDGNYTEQTFDDVEVEVDTGAGKATYSISTESIPTMGYNETSEINAAYYALPEGDWGNWPAQLEAAVRPVLLRVLGNVQSGSL